MCVCVCAPFLSFAGAAHLRTPAICAVVSSLRPKPRSRYNKQRLEKSSSKTATWRVSQTWKQVSHRHLTSCMTILLLLQRFKPKMKSNRMPDDGGRGRGRGPPPPRHTNLEEYERKLSRAAHDDVFADSSDELSRP